MEPIKTLSDSAILAELGHRLTQCRIRSRLTQAELAEQAGISKRTVERIENGASTQLASLIRILRVLDLLSGLDALLPAVNAGPIDLLEGKTRPPQRVREAQAETNSKQPWRWDDDS